MERTVAWRCLMVAVICGAVLSLPLGNPAAACVQAPGCPHCQMAGLGMAHCPCCPHPAKPSPGGACAQSHSLICHCITSIPAFITSAATALAAWQVRAYVPAGASVSHKLFTPHIFHPPQMQALPLQI